MIMRYIAVVTVLPVTSTGVFSASSTKCCTISSPETNGVAPACPARSRHSATSVAKMPLRKGS